MDNGHRRPDGPTGAGASSRTTAREQRVAAAAAAAAAGPEREDHATSSDRSRGRTLLLLALGAVVLAVVVAAWALVERSDSRDALSDARAKLVDARASLGEAQADVSDLREELTRVDALRNVADQLFECLEVTTAREQGVQPYRVDVADDICITAIQAYAYAFAPGFGELPE